MRHAILLFVTCLLAACGGGGGGGTISPPTITITVQPTPAVAYETQDANFQVSATAISGTLSYQWQKNGVAILNETSRTLTLPALSANDNKAVITVTVGNGKADADSVTSTAALLTVKPAAPSVVTAPTAKSIDVGQTATFTITADGLPPLAYQWYKNGAQIPGATSTEYTTPTQQVSDSGSRYSVKVKTTSGKETISEEAALTVFNAGLKDLIISEVSSCVKYTSKCWFEIYNPTAEAIDLSKYKVSVTSSSNLGSKISTYNFPALTIGAGAYQVISGNATALEQRGTFIVLLSNSSYVPDWSNNGFIELLDSATNRTVDFIKFDASNQSPVTAGFWSGGAVTDLVKAYGQSVVRAYPITENTRSSADWILVPWVTPGGRNDIASDVTDGDADGIPATAKISGNTFAGLDLYAMGARPRKKDIFIEIDYMDSPDPGVTPRIEALQKVVDAFAKKNIAIHFDAGTLFSENFNPALFNLGQGSSKVPYEKCVAFDQITCAGNISSRRSVYDWKEQFMDVRRRPVFHYLLMGYSQFDNAPQGGSSGRAEINGNDIIVTQGNWGLSNTSNTNLTILINYQAAVIMHELGHNLGLRHGGSEDQNYKPNYTSVMNYLYQGLGLEQDLSSGTAYERWRYFSNSYYGKPKQAPCTMKNALCNSDFVIDYSDGKGADLSESNLSEALNIGHGSTPGAYADWNGDGKSTAGSISVDLNPQVGPNFGVLKDFNDWDNLQLPYSRYLNGNFAAPQVPLSQQPLRDPIANDRQTTIPEEQQPQDLIDLIRASR